MIFRVLVLGTDERIISGESGAVCVGALSWMFVDPGGSKGSLVIQRLDGPFAVI